MHNKKLHYTLAGIITCSLFYLMILCNVALAGDLKSFRIGVYVNGDTHPQNLPASRMMADMAGHGITRAILLTKQYMELAPQGLNTLAKQWGIELWIGNIRAGDPTDESNMRMMIKLVNSYPDPDAVTGWYADDEVELNYDPARNPGIEKKIRDFVSLIRKLDPKRKTIVNHDARTHQWGGRFMNLGEDISSCSVFWANQYATKFLQKTMDTYHKAYGKNAPPLIFVYGAQSTNTFTSPENMSGAGLEGVTIPELQAIKTGADITDYIMTAHKLGASGASFYIYDGYYDSKYYTLVDERGRSVDGKMEAIQDAADQIAKSEGRPTLKLDVKLEGNAQVITVNPSTCISVKVEISNNGGYTWTPIKGFSKSGGTVKYTPPHTPLIRSYWGMIRARCFDGTKYSQWRVWNVYPWSEPKM
jgi:hypothetical protein